MELKSAKDLVGMRRAGRAAARALSRVMEAAQVGVTTQALDRVAERAIRAEGGTPTFLGYRGYPACVCLSINDEVVHGIPSPQRRLSSGDIVGIDIGVTLDGWVGDTAFTVAIGDVSEKVRALLEAGEKSLERGIQACRVGGRLGDVSSAIQIEAEGRGFGVVRDFVGHGIGRAMHEDPAVPNFGSPGTGVRLEAGLVLALEPMLTAGDWKVKVNPDGWTVVTADGGWSSHFEHTVALTDKGPEILTRRGT